MILDVETLSANTVVSLGSAVVVMGAAIKGTMVLTNIHRDIRDLKGQVVKRDELNLLLARMARDNPGLKVEELESIKESP